MGPQDEDDVARAMVGMPPATPKEKAAIVSYRQRLIQFFEAAEFYKVHVFPETEPQTHTSMQGTFRQVAHQFEIPTNLRIEMSCPTCGDTVRTFAIDFGPEGDRSRSVGLSIDSSRSILFRCTHCQKQHAAFLVHVGRIAATEGLCLVKAGVWPSARPAPTPNLAKGLGAAVGMFSKGLMVQKFGFGIGAFAYYRRVTEDIIERLLLALRQYADEAGEAALLKAIDQTAAETQASKRIAVVKDMVPKVLRPNGMNPLGALYEALSDGLHGRTDEECLERAEALRATIEFLVTRLESLVTTPKQYVDAMKKLKEPQGGSVPKAAKPAKVKK